MQRCVKVSATVLAMVALLSGCATTPEGPMAGAKLEARSDSSARGVVSFTEIEKNMKVFVDITGINPGEHGFHIHEVGDCSAFDGSSAKGHYNPDSKAHGHHVGTERHAGDMPNLLADDYGTVRTTLFVSGLTLSGDKSIVGRSVVVHAAPDDYKSQPAGNSGKRIACGVITPM